VVVRAQDGQDDDRTKADFATARHALKLEAEAVTALAESLDERFIAALDCIEAIDGRVIVTGMGKSGHIGNKISATLASTGTPSFFVHPGEASHGDLGMITRHDAVIALSNSGKTAELGDVVAFTRRFAVPLIAITGKADSTLAKAADIALTLPKMPEACPMGLAPTTSTTMTLALGDALAIALLERRGFSAEQFQVFHPGGALGKKLVKVSEIMHSGDEVPLCRPETEMDEAILVMTTGRFGCVGVVDAAGALIGIITDGDLRRHMSDDLLEKTAGEVMTAGPRTIRPDALAAEALHVMNLPNKLITALYVVDDNRPIGILHVHDLLHAGVA
jgi:arabinose-5-phosphate isomerase